MPNTLKMNKNKSNNTNISMNIIPLSDNHVFVNTSNTSRINIQSQSCKAWGNTQLVDYVKKHRIKGHETYCYSWLDLGLCAQEMLGYQCCYKHEIPLHWTSIEKMQHNLKLKAMSSLYCHENDNNEDERNIQLIATIYHRGSSDKDIKE